MNYEFLITQSLGTPLIREIELLPKRQLETTLPNEGSFAHSGQVRDDFVIYVPEPAIVHDQHVLNGHSCQHSSDFGRD